MVRETINYCFCIRSKFLHAKAYLLAERHVVLYYSVQVFSMYIIIITLGSYITTECTRLYVIETVFHLKVDEEQCSCCCCLHIKNRSDLYPVPFSFLLFKAKKRISVVTS